MTEIEVGTVARYCKSFDIPPVCFQLRPTDNGYLSVYLLEFFNRPTEKENVFCVKTELEKRLTIKPKGAFALLDIVKSKEIFQHHSEIISYQEKGLPHCGIFHKYNDGSNDLVIAELLTKCVKTSYKVKDLDND